MHFIYIDFYNSSFRFFTGPQSIVSALRGVQHTQLVVTLIVLSFVH